MDDNNKPKCLVNGKTYVPARFALAHDVGDGGDVWARDRQADRVRQITGAPPRSPEAFVAENHAAFGG